jgi:hypothetical protein
MQASGPSSLQQSALEAAEHAASINKNGIFETSIDWMKINQQYIIVGQSLELFQSLGNEHCDSK